MADQARAQIGVTGLAVMGRNLARNLARHGYTVAVHNRSVGAHPTAWCAEYGDEGTFVPARVDGRLRRRRWSGPARSSSWSRPAPPPTR